MSSTRLLSYNPLMVTTHGILSTDGIVIKSQDPTLFTEGSDSCFTACLPCLADSTASNVYVDEYPYHSKLRHVSGNHIIPYGHILDAAYLDDNSTDSTDPFSDRNDVSSAIPAEPTVTITYIKSHKQDIVTERLTMTISRDTTDSQTDIVGEILERSYKNAKRNRSILVVINPHGGSGEAQQLYMSKCHPILLGSKATVEISYTKCGGHAIDIARELDMTKYDTIACASGDGIPHEIINGLFQRSDRVEAFNKLAITQLPCGSGNAMSVSCHWTTNPSYAALCLVKGIEARVDLMSCSQESYFKVSPRLSFLSQTYGVIAESDINTEFIRWMGPARFDIGVALNVLQRKKYPCDIYVKYAAKEKSEVKTHYEVNKDKSALVFEETTTTSSSRIPFLSSSRNLINVTEENFHLKFPLDKGVPDDWEKLDQDFTDNIGIFYTGKMPYIAPGTQFFPAALPSDGTIDIVITDARTPISIMTPILLSIDKGSHVQHPKVIHSKILAYKIVPKVTNSVISVDGERFPLEPLQVEIMPQLCKTLLRNGQFVNTEFEYA